MRRLAAIPDDNRRFRLGRGPAEGKELAWTQIREASFPNGPRWQFPKVTGSKVNGCRLLRSVTLLLYSRVAACGPGRVADSHGFFDVSLLFQRVCVSDPTLPNGRAIWQSGRRSSHSLFRDDEAETGSHHRRISGRNLERGAVPRGRIRSTGSPGFSCG